MTVAHVAVNVTDWNAAKQFYEAVLGPLGYGVVYEGDELEYSIERGRRVIQSHKQELDNIDSGKIKAAYCVIEPGGNVPAHTEIMTMAQILRSWKMSKTYDPEGKRSSPHRPNAANAIIAIATNGASNVDTAASRDANVINPQLRIC